MMLLRSASVHRKQGKKKEGAVAGNMAVRSEGIHNGKNPSEQPSLQSRA